ncbi:MAG TPA: ATP-binding protein, partial [Clostridia bacterium]|nr:ATP-binding protein [Clostridia bacterium]
EKQIHREIPEGTATPRWTEELQTGCAIGPEFYDWPIRGGETTLGTIRIPVETAKNMGGSQRRMLLAAMESTALAMDRVRATRQREKSNEQIVQERYRANLLRAISHDLRTPLAGIMGTAEMVMNMTEKSDRRYALMEAVNREAGWLHALVENILSLTRLQDGRLELHKQKEAAEEVVDAAIRRISRHYPEREIAVNVPDELLIVPMDAKLIGQVLFNLLDNAVKHTPDQEEISVAVTKDIHNNRAVFVVRDRGKGIAPSDLPSIFQAFYTSRAKHRDAQFGIGLGLAICDAVVRAHGGDIAAGNRTDGPGSEFRFALPLEGEEHE